MPESLMGVKYLDSHCAAELLLKIFVEEDAKLIFFSFFILLVLVFGIVR